MRRACCGSRPGCWGAGTPLQTRWPRASSAPPVADPADTEADLERADQLLLVERALADLSPDKREAFVLKHVEGLSYEEMAVVTGERIPTLKMRVHRAREALLKVLEDHA